MDLNAHPLSLVRHYYCVLVIDVLLEVLMLYVPSRYYVFESQPRSPLTYLINYFCFIYVFFILSSLILSTCITSVHVLLPTFSFQHNNENKTYNRLIIRHHAATTRWPYILFVYIFKYPTLVVTDSK